MDKAFSGAKTRLYAFLDSLLCPPAVRTNQNTGLIRLIACLCMAIDHAGKMLFPDLPVMRLIGRIAFPLFAYGVAVGAVYTKNPTRYLARIVLLALISQPLYALGLDHENSAMYAVSFLKNPLSACWNFYINSWQKPSILLSLALGLCILICLRQRRFVLAAGLYVLCARFAADLDYGLFGIQLMILFYALCGHPLLFLISLPAFVVSWSQGFGYMFFGHSFSMRIYCLPAILLAWLPLKRNLALPRWFIYGFYPAHLAVLAFIVHL